MNRKFLSLALLVALACAAPALAATPQKHNNEGKGEIGFGVGQASSDVDGVNDSTLIGIRGGYNFTPQFQLEGQYSSGSASTDISGLDGNTDVIMVNGVMNFHPSKQEYVPYVMAGVGRVDAKADGAGISESDDSMAYQIGGGTRIFFGKAQRMAFRADL